MAICPRTEQVADCSIGYVERKTSLSDGHSTVSTGGHIQTQTAAEVTAETPPALKRSVRQTRLRGDITIRRLQTSRRSYAAPEASGGRPEQLNRDDSGTGIGHLA